ncbi:MAG: Cytidylyltransferase family protein [Promethearchaeota archaeon]|nr:MAG: Cytidylyltransferase family protein [Candidatus Lokiarchaeota archaeon]
MELFPSNYDVIALIVDLMLVLVAFLYVGISIFTPMILYKKEKINKFQARKMVHLFAGLAVLVTPFFTWKLFGTIIAGLLTVVTLLSSKKSKVKKLQELYETIGEEAEESLERPYLQGPFHYCLAITLIVTIAAIFFPNQIYFAIAGILIMIISDTLASLFGKKYGKHPINISWTKTTRSLEGSIMMFLSAFILCFGAFLIYGFFNIGGTQQALNFFDVLILSLITSLVATFIELISPSTWDDLTIPIGTTLSIFLIVYLASLI